MSGEFNQQSMSEISDNIINVLNLCLQNKELWKTDKYGMLRKIKDKYEDFYELYPRICRILVFSDDITPLLGMIQTFSKVQSGELSFQDANDSITNAINAKYIDGVLNSETLVKEREEKIKKEKKEMIIE
jgi:hypothetical protein